MSTVTLLNWKNSAVGDGIVEIHDLSLCGDTTNSLHDASMIICRINCPALAWQLSSFLLCFSSLLVQSIARSFDNNGGRSQSSLISMPIGWSSSENFKNRVDKASCQDSVLSSIGTQAGAASFERPPKWAATKLHWGQWARDIRR